MAAAFEVVLPVEEVVIGCSVPACWGQNALAGCFYRDADGGRVYYFTPSTWPTKDMYDGISKCEPTCF